MTDPAPAPSPDDRLRLGLPSKGRLREDAAAWFADRGLQVVQTGEDRAYSGEIRGVDGVDLVLLSAGEIPAELSAGRLHLGVTGEDMIRERVPDADARVRLAAPMGFGHADLVLAVPDFWIDVESTHDLDEVAAEFRERLGRPLRIATKYHVLTRAFLRDRGVGDCVLVDSQGATEAVVRNGAADAVCDITSTGATLRANGLRVLADGLVLSSQAQLCLSRTAPMGAAARRALSQLRETLGVNALASSTTGD
jgi:ATP phosphoribosyltransferase